MKKASLLLVLAVLVLITYSQDATTIYKNTVNSTVTIVTDNSQGSGFFVGTNMIATNYHVIEGATKAICYVNGSSTQYKIEGYLGFNKSADLIILRVTGLNRESIKFTTHSVSPGDKIYAIGSPKGLQATISDGIVSGLRDFDGFKLIQITAPISPGSSGGPVLNSKGEVIGVSVGQLRDGQNLNFAIPIKYVNSLKGKSSSIQPISKFIRLEIKNIESPFKIEGSFKSVKIGSQIWMAENLNVSTFRNGDQIPEARTTGEWEKAFNEGKPVWCYYKNDPAIGKKYGKLFNRYAVSDPRGLAPMGWHIPNDEEWIDLLNFLDGEKNAGRKIKTTSGWLRNGNGTNSSGFKGLPGGSLRANGIFEDVGSYANWWSSSLLNILNDRNSKTNRGFGCTFENSNAFIFTESGNTGFYVRCIKD